MREKLFFVGVKALIKNPEGKILLLKASTRNHLKNTEPYWDIPGGRIEEGASVEETLKREIEEETGIREACDIRFFTAVISNHEIPLDQSHKAGLVLMIYEVKIPTDSKIRLSPEHTAYEWVDAQDAGLRLANKYPEHFTNSLN